MENPINNNPINEEDNILKKYILNRVLNRNKNFLMVFIGPTGSGKSYSALRLAETLDSSFNIDRVCFKAIQFMDVVNSLVEKSNIGEDIRGKVILWDEAGVENNAREFMSISNRVMNYFFQTSRHLNLIVIMTVPLLSFIDSSTRKLIHCIGEVEGINPTANKTVVKIKMVQTNVLSGKEYYKYLRYSKDGVNYVCQRVRFSLPSKELLTAYEMKKKSFTTNLNNEIMKKLGKVQEENNKPAPVTKMEILTPYQKQVLDCIKNGITSQKEIAKRLGKKVYSVSDVINSLRKKGYKIGLRGYVSI